jgi:hypothetical protein
MRNEKTTPMIDTIPELLSLIKTYLRQIPGLGVEYSKQLTTASFLDRQYVTLQWERSFMVTASATISFDIRWDTGIDSSDDLYYELKLESSTSMSSRPVDEAQAMIDLYQDIVKGLRAIDQGMKKFGRIVQTPEVENAEVK